MRCMYCWMTDCMCRCMCCNVSRGMVPRTLWLKVESLRNLKAAVICWPSNCKA